MKPRIKVELDGNGGGKIMIGKVDISNLVTKVEIIADVDKQYTKVILTCHAEFKKDMKLKAEIDNLKNVQFVESLNEKEN